MEIEKVADIISKIAAGFEEACVQCLSDKSGVVVDAIKEQLYSGRNGEEGMLSPTYSADPYFNEKGRWFHRSEDYRQWKYIITPPESGAMLGLPPRPDDVPNLFIDGTFYSGITATRIGDVLKTDATGEIGPEIVSKYGSNILNIGPTAIEYFNKTYMLPAIGKHFEDCGYK